VEAERAMLDGDARPAADLVATARPDLLLFGCTSAGSLGGPGHDRDPAEELGARARAPGLDLLTAAGTGVNVELARPTPE
jgi:maleate isomerase